MLIPENNSLRPRPLWAEATAIPTAATVEVLDRQLGWFEPPAADENALTIG